MANPNPDVVALRAHGRGRVFWEEKQFDHWAACKIKGLKYSPLPTSEHPTFIDKREVLRRTGLSYVTIWSLERKGQFPPRVRLTGEVADAAD
jgi:Prophage CP4-57 regulatory protein (AlpA)